MFFWDINLTLIALYICECKRYQCIQLLFKSIQLSFINKEKAKPLRIIKSDNKSIRTWKKWTVKLVISEYYVAIEFKSKQNQSISNNFVRNTGYYNEKIYEKYLISFFNV